MYKLIRTKKIRDTRICAQEKNWIGVQWMEELVNAKWS